MRFLEPRGSQDGDSSHALNLQLAKGFKIGHTRLQLIGTVYNAFSNEYAIAVYSWENNWAELATFFDFPAEIRP